MEAIKHFEKVKEFIEDHQDEFDKEKLLEYGSTALLLLSGIANRKLIKGLIIGTVIFAAGKLTYDYLAEKAEAAEKA